MLKTIPENIVEKIFIEFLQNYSPFLIANGRFSNVSYEVNTSQSSSSHNRYILHASVQCIMIADRNASSEREFDRNPFGIRFHKHDYIPSCNTNRGLTFDAMMKMLVEIREFMTTVLIWDEDEVKHIQNICV